MAGDKDFERGYLEAHENLYFHGVLGGSVCSYWPLFYLLYYPLLDQAKCHELMVKIVDSDGGCRLSKSY